jgi:hypothetical protein
MNEQTHNLSPSSPTGGTVTRGGGGWQTVYREPAIPWDPRYMRVKRP